MNLRFRLVDDPQSAQLYTTKHHQLKALAAFLRFAATAGNTALWRYLPVNPRPAALQYPA